MSEIVTIWNKGKRTWTFKNANGEQVRLSPNESMEMEATRAVKLVESYHRDFSTSKVTGVSSSDLARREQSIKDREAALKEKIADLEAREKENKEPMTVAKAIEIIAPFLSDEGTAYLAENNTAWKSDEEMASFLELQKIAEPKKRGRKPKAETQEAE